MKIRDVISLLKVKQDETGSEPEPMLDVYTKIRERFKPVMRHYFTEKHRSPMTWFHMRLCYTRSVATTSIVGHVLGLGDRHVSNILLDNGSGEVVHIDLGIAFDQVGRSYALIATPLIVTRSQISTGQASQNPRTCSIPYDTGHGGRNGHIWNPRCIPTMRRRNSSCFAGRL